MGRPGLQYGPLTELQRETVAANLGVAIYAIGLRRQRALGILNEDDLTELAWIGLCKGAQRHNPKRGKFSTIATRAIFSEINSELRKQARKKRRPCAPILSLSIDQKLEPTQFDIGLDDVDNADWMDCYQG